MQNYKLNNPARGANIVLSYLLLVGGTIGVRLWTVTALPSVEVCGRRSSIQSVCLRLCGVFIGWTILGLFIVRMVTIVRINRECGQFTRVLRTTTVMDMVKITVRCTVKGMVRITVKDTVGEWWCELQLRAQL